MSEAASVLASANQPLKAPVSIGGRFGRLHILSDAPRVRGKRKVLCRCDCGTEKIIDAGSIRNGDVRSCGCLSREQVSVRSITHGHAVGGVLPSEYVIWANMRYRCSNPKNKSFPRYGGRGIRVCERWDQSFAHFLEDMGRRPSPSHSIERINNGGHYEPENCRWATPVQQANNKRGNHVITIGERSQTIAQWAREIGIKPSIIRGRIYEGWSEEDAVMRPKTDPAEARAKAIAARWEGHNA